MTTGLIVALDDPDLLKAEALAQQLRGKVDALKVGLTLIHGYGPEAVLEIGQHAPVFLDAKLHDIPHQISGAVSEIARQKVWMFTIHSSGGPSMISAAAAAAAPYPNRPLIAAVTVLTSLSSDDLSKIGQGVDTQAQVLRLATLALDAGATAIVCSPQEVAMIRKELGPDPILVVPGIRLVGAREDDQARVMTPAMAAEAGASYVVVGRPVTGSPDPSGTADLIVRELAG